MDLLPKRPLGRTGIEVSVLGLGTVKFGRNQGVKYPEGFALPDDGQIRSLLSTARSLGITLVDTAPAYGISEQRLGENFERDDWILSTKCGEEFDAGASHFDFSAAHTRASVQRSLDRLRASSLDLVLIHCDGQDLAALDQDVLPALFDLREAGLVRAVGASVKTVEGGLEALRRGCEVLMVEYHPWNPAMRPVLDAAAEQGCGILIKKAFASGHFGAGGGVQEALDFVFDHPAVSSVIVGTLTEVHLRENAAAALAAAGS